MHGGRSGDVFYSLYAAMMLGGGTFQLCLYHAPVAWNIELLESVLSLVKYQTYIVQADVVKIPHRWRNVANAPYADIGIDFRQITHDFIHADTVRNPERFPELTPGEWPSNVHLAKRYCDPWHVEWDPELKWLTVPTNAMCFDDIVFHVPLRRSIRSKQSWLYILNKLKSRKLLIRIIAGENDIGEWKELGFAISKPRNFLQSAIFINSSKVFLGVASSCNVIAEGLKHPRCVELADDCYNTYPFGDTGVMINGMSDDAVVELVAERCK